MGLPKTMTAVDITEPGGPEVLRAVERPVPEPRPGEVLIRVRGAGVNRPDCLQRQGLYPVPADADPLPGLEVAGEVVASAEGAGRWRARAAGARATGSARWCTAAATPNTAGCPPNTACRCRMS